MVAHCADLATASGLGPGPFRGFPIAVHHLVMISSWRCSTIVQECLGTIQMLAVVLHIDIASVECNHASVRRLLRLGAQTHRRPLADVSADFILLKGRVLEALGARPRQKQQKVALRCPT